MQKPWFTSGIALLLFGLAALPASAQQWRSLDGPGWFGRGAAFDAHRGRLVAFGVDGGTWEWDGSRWLSRPTTVAPVQRARHTMVYDAVRGHVLLFGGSTPLGTPLGDTWAWDGAEWRSLPSTPRPAALQDQTAAFDETRGEVVLFSTSDRTTWVHDGMQWRQLTPATSPPTMGVACMAFDAARSVTLLFSIGNGVQFWQWNGNDWSQLPGPGGLVLTPGDCNAAFDRARQRLVVFEPQYSPGETWEWDGSAWLRLPSSLHRTRQAMYFDSRRQQVVVNAGFDDSSFRSDQWAWNGSAWSLVAPERRPCQREEPAVCHDPMRGRTLLFGGLTGADTSDDTWQWDGQEWQRLQPATSPRNRRGASMCFDPGRGCIALFGGTANMVSLDDLWFWNGGSWLPTAPTTRPPTRCYGGLCADSVRGRLVLFGGVGQQGQLLADTWEWNGTTWLPRAPVSAPGVRVAAALAFDPLRQRTVLFGGWDGSIWRRDTWEWDGSSWQAVQPAVAPSALRSPASVFDPVRGRLVLAGLTDSFPANFETWDFDGTTWSALFAQGVIPTASLRLVHDAVRGRNVLFDGKLVLELTATPAAVTSYGTGCGTPAPVLAGSAQPRTGAATFGLETAVQPGQAVLFAAGRGSASTPLGNGCVLLLQQPIATVVAVADGFGMAVQPVPVPGNQALRGLALTAQAAVLSASSPGGLALSQGLRFVVGD